MSEIKVLPPVHVDFESAYEVDNYPYGGYRTKMRYWIESKKHQGQRIVSCSLNPKTGRWNKPHAGTYSTCKVMFINLENNHVEFEGFDMSDHSKAESFLEAYREGLNQTAINTVTVGKASHIAYQEFNFYFHPELRDSFYQKVNELLESWGYGNLKFVKKSN